jgi:hypothetical protein
MQRERVALQLSGGPVFDITPDFDEVERSLRR